jgi:hypothetical protein
MTSAHNIREVEASGVVNSDVEWVIAETLFKGYAGRYHGKI